MFLIGLKNYKWRVNNGYALNQESISIASSNTDAVFLATPLFRAKVSLRTKKAPKSQVSK